MKNLVTKHAIKSQQTADCQQKPDRKYKHFFFLLECRHSFNILEKTNVMRGYMAFYFKRVLFKTNIYIHR